MDLFLGVHVQKQYLLKTLLINFLTHFKWTLLERFLRSLLRILVIKSLIDNIFVKRPGLRAYYIKIEKGSKTTFTAPLQFKVNATAAREVILSRQAKVLSDQNINVHQLENAFKTILGNPVAWSMAIRVVEFSSGGYKIRKKCLRINILKGNY